MAVDDLVARSGDGEPGVRAGRRDLGHGCQEPGRVGPVRVEIPAEMGPAGVVEEGEGEIGLEHGVA